MPKQKNIGLDILKIVAAFTVVLIHSPNPHAACSADVALRILPPANALFALVAGMFMGGIFQPDFMLGPWMKKRAMRLVVPYLIWATAYVLANVAFDRLRLGHAQVPIADWR